LSIVNSTFEQYGGDLKDSLRSPLIIEMDNSAATEFLKSWLIDRKQNPYPSPKEKAILMYSTGLSRSQLDHWFTNARQRYVKPKNRRGPNPNYSRYSPDVTHILVDWLTENIKYPYPNTQEQAILLRKTGLSKRQLQNWFTNARKRQLAKRILEPEESNTKKLKPAEIPASDLLHVVAPTLSGLVSLEDIQRNYFTMGDISSTSVQALREYQRQLLARGQEISNGIINLSPASSCAFPLIFAPPPKFLIPNQNKVDKETEAAALMLHLQRM